LAVDKVIAIISRLTYFTHLIYELAAQKLHFIMNIIRIVKVCNAMPVCGQAQNFGPFV